MTAARLGTDLRGAHGGGYRLPLYTEFPDMDALSGVPRPPVERPVHGRLRPRLHAAGLRLLPDEDRPALSSWSTQDL